MNERKSVHHIVLAYYPENIEDAVGLIQKVLNVELFYAPEGLAVGTRVWVNYDIGLEIIAPVGRAGDLGLTGDAATASDRIYTHLEERGEGLYTLVFDVGEELEEAVDRAVEFGGTVGIRQTMPEDALGGIFEKFDEVDIGNISGVYWWLSRIVKK